MVPFDPIVIVPGVFKIVRLVSAAGSCGMRFGTELQLELELGGKIAGAPGEVTIALL